MTRDQAKAQETPKIADTMQQETPKVAETMQQETPKVAETMQQETPKVADAMQQETPKVAETMGDLRLYVSPVTVYVHPAGTSKQKILVSLQLSVRSEVGNEIVLWR